MSELWEDLIEEIQALDQANLREPPDVSRPRKEAVTARSAQNEQGGTKDSTSCRGSSDQSNGQFEASSQPVPSPKRDTARESLPRSSRETARWKQAGLWSTEGSRPGGYDDDPSSRNEHLSYPEAIPLSPLAPFLGTLPALMTSEDPHQNRHRWYGFSFEESFFGDLSVVCSWGGIGQKACGHKSWPVVDEHDARKQISKMMAKRTSRGYRLLLAVSGQETARPKEGAA